MKKISELSGDIVAMYSISEQEDNLFMYKIGLVISKAQNAYWEDHGNYIKVYCHNVVVSLYKSINLHTIAVLEP